MRIKFRQGWTDLKWYIGNITFFDIEWDQGIDWGYFTLAVTILNFSIQLEIG